MSDSPAESASALAGEQNTPHGEGDQDRSQPSFCTERNVNGQNKPLANNHECALMTIPCTRAITSRNIAALPKRLLPSVSTAWEKQGRATYRLYITYHRRTPDAAVESLWSKGTVVHIGEGLFLTCAHICAWPAALPTGVTFSPETHSPKLWLRSAAGNLTRYGAPGRGDVEAQVASWPAQISADDIRDGLLQVGYQVPPGKDFCLLRSVSEVPRLRRHRRHCCCGLSRSSRPHVEPESGRLLPRECSITFVGINSATDDLCLLPEQISYATAEGVYEAERQRLGISATSGAGGSGVYRTINRRLVAICTDTSGDAIPISAPAFREFVGECIIPEFERVGTAAAIELARVWVDAGDF